jgi:predicted DNA-binding protein (MmcQ/YjbR family)
MKPETMTGEQLQDIARSTAIGLPGVSHGRPFVDKLDVYKAAGKVFLIVTDDPDELIITVKAEPEFGWSLQREYGSIGPGRYLNKVHWISVGAGRKITTRLVKELVTHSYDLVLDLVPPDRHPAQGRGLVG